MANGNEPATGPVLSTEPRPPSRAHHWAWAGAVAFAALCALTGFVVYQCSPGTQAGKFVNASADGMARLLDAIKQDNVVQTFREHLETIQPDLAGRLLVADVKANEEFSEEDTDLLGTTSADIRVPVTYYYYVALSDPWILQTNVTAGGAVTCAVLAPAVKSLPAPSIDTSHLEIKSENGWLRWDKNEVTADLLRELTPKLSARAAQKLPQFFPQARESVEKFVKDWILKEYRRPPGAPVFINVTFRNEPAAPGTPSFSL
ncbi:MAG: hypothetical protein ABSH19_02255, partial [Opitutales bacterium]